EETVGYEKARDEAGGKVTRARAADVRALGRVQNGLKEETAELTRRLEGAPVFALTLKRAGEGMEVAAQRLQTVKTDEDTHRAEKLTDAQQAELDRLQDDERTIADLTRDLTQPKRDDGEED